jgi:D-methionine transport system ATP-binding protein
VVAEPVISLRDAGKSFPGPDGKPVVALQHVDLDVGPGDILGVIGYSGAGKSTLIRLINGLERATEGSVVVHGQPVTELTGRELRALRSDIGMVFQQFNLFRSRTVAGNVAYPLRLAGWSADRRKARVAELLEFVGIADKARAYPAQLSGGQRQRVGIARALATSPRILLADEATSALDPETTAEVLALLRRINRELGATIVAVTHEMEVVSSTCRSVAVLEGGRLVEHGPVYDVFSEPERAATRRFVHSVLRDRPSPETLERLRRHVPGRLVTVPIREGGLSQAGLNELLDRHAVRGTIVFGGVGELADKPFGSITYALTGPDGAVEQVLAALRGLTPVEVMA